MAYLIQLPDGSQMIVESLDGHDDCTVLDANSPPMTLDDMKTMKRGEVDLYLYGQFQLGFTPTDGACAGHTLQTRDDTDRTNWLTSQAAYSAAVAQGAGATTGASFRTADNATITTTYADGLNTLLEMAAWGKTIMGKSWTLKDQITALTDAASVEAFDVSTQWAALP